MTFAGFGDGAVEFYDGLLADNSKAYWTDQRAVYEEHVKAPMQALLTELESEFGVGKIFRPYRDVRFSTDKAPYKTHCGGYTAPYYVQVGPDGLLAAAGYYGMAPDQLARFRAAVDDERRGTELERILDATGLTVGGEQLKTRPKGTDPEHPRLDLLRRKGLMVSRRWQPNDALHERTCLTRVRTVWRAGTPLAEWLADHVGPSEQPRR